MPLVKKPSPLVGGSKQWKQTSFYRASWQQRSIWKGAPEAGKSTVFKKPSQVRFTKRGEQWAHGSSVVHMMESIGHTTPGDSRPRSDSDTVGDILSLENETPNSMESLLGSVDLQSNVVTPKEAWLEGQ
ncbi:hypothetical protein JMJ77_0006169 [Colletotrichum scovillei]|uniref:Uncharacterized protein n=1 Tax=Colletotrichum scovillei TaxID=1209932 RepID=A0A9P7RK81_9PEZI|nr:hypothetical protein JMJ77_0006169 [Colletotrichum scovillei]KAG7077404.1 hypothetical protein JMJ76_0014652 [Colletotrichum scovillei]KAG7084550.1 hypothetical protein JMJ78_0009984 [Colletotrichum scovillei]